MKKEEAEEYTQSLGQIVGGSWRQIAWAKQQGIPKALGLTVDEWVKERLGGYIRMNVEDRREAVKELTANGESQREVAEVLGVTPMTVNRDLNPVTNDTPDGPEPAEKSQSNNDDITNVTPDVLDTIAALSVDASKVAHVSNNSGENEWYTPSYLIEAATNVMGTIDLDPASSAIANKSILAGKYFTKKDDGLNQEWFGNIWLNPPYAQPLMGLFADAVVTKYAADEFDQACVLVNNATETEWFQKILMASSAACFLKGRVKFLDPEGNPGAPLQGQAVLYLGASPGEFSLEFSGLGVCLIG